MDLFLALTSDDEDNIMACLLAKRLGATPRAGADQPQGLRRPGAGHQIDIAISPAQAVIGELLAYVRRGDVEAVHCAAPWCGRGAGGIVRGDTEVVPDGRPAHRARSRCRRGAQIGAIVRGLPVPTAAPGDGEAAPQRPRSSSPTTTR